VKVLAEMATFESAGVTNREDLTREEPAPEDPAE
jgi:hypothetical protein